MTGTVLVVGAAGQLGCATVEAYRPGGAVVGLTRSDLDLTDHAAVLRTLRRERPTVVLNCAAYNHVDAAEDDPVPALEVNAFAVRSLARAARDVGAVFVHYSTDFVFDGVSSRPYVEDDAPNPRSTYGASKLLGEWFAREGPSSYVLRVESLFGGARAKSSIDRIVDALTEGRETRVFVDRTISPSYVPDVIRATRTLLDSRAPTGLYHCVNTGSVTWYELAKEAAAIIGASSAALVPISARELSLQATRPLYCAMSNAKLVGAGVAMPVWQDALRRHLELRRARQAEIRA